jgi:biotin synthase-like enzyme
MVLKAVALTRLVCPEANLPATTALATINTVDGREHGLESGGNVFMPILTPSPYRQMYQIYPGKACVDEDATQCNQCLRGRIQRLNRHVGEGQGGRKSSGGGEAYNGKETAPATKARQPLHKEPLSPSLQEDTSPLVVLR